jgi:solute carrier family 25 phosphate transporter 23/24/25/41
MSAVKGPQLQSPSSASQNVQIRAPDAGLTGPAQAIPVPDRFAGFYEWISQPVVAAFCGGGVAGAVSRTVVSPLERLKILLQIQSAGRDAYKLSVGQALGKMWREEGWRGFMRGNGTNCIRIVPYSAVQFSSYNFYKRVSRQSANRWEEYVGTDMCWGRTSLNRTRDKI